MTIRNNQNTNSSIRYLYASITIVLGFFLAYLPQTNLANWQLVMAISFGYGVSIYGLIWLSWFFAQLLLKNNLGKLSFWRSVSISLVGLVPGAFLGSLLKAKIINNPTPSFSSVPEVILIGVFITLLFHYWEKSLIQDRENSDLKSINDKLEASRDKKYLEQISSRIGTQSKVLKVQEIEYFVSENHCTMAVINNQEFFVEVSLKKLAEELNPQHFLQIHRNSIIRIDQIKTIKNGSNWVLETLSGRELSISRSSRKKIKDVLL